MSERARRFLTSTVENGTGGIRQLLVMFPYARGLLLSCVSLRGCFERKHDLMQGVQVVHLRRDCNFMVRSIGVSGSGPTLSNAASSRRNPRSAACMCANTCCWIPGSRISFGFHTLARVFNSPRYMRLPSACSICSIS